MSGLAGVLAGHTRPGIYQWHAAFDVADVRRSVEQAGWRFAALDGWTRGSKSEVLTALGEELAFPTTYGANLDALNDSLRDLTDPTVLLWDGWSTLARSDERTFGVLLRILRRPDALTVLLRGEGPELDVPSLD